MSSTGPGQFPLSLPIASAPGIQWLTNKLSRKKQKLTIFSNNLSYVKSQDNGCLGVKRWAVTGRGHEGGFKVLSCSLSAAGDLGMFASS